MTGSAAVSSAASIPGRLARLSVIDLTQMRAGPTAARRLADWGADMIHADVRYIRGIGVEGYGQARAGTCHAENS